MSAAFFVFAPGFWDNEAVHVALAVGTAVAIVTGVVGVFTVMRGQSFAGEALGDIGTTGGSAAALVGAGPLAGFVAVDVLAARRWSWSACSGCAGATWRPGSSSAPRSASPRSSSTSTPPRAAATARP